MASAAQIAANRANSKKSTGPVTPEGRARSALNARKYGLFSKKEARAREESIAFENRRMKWMAIGDVQEDREEFLTYLNVCQSFDFERAQRAQIERIESLIENAEQDDDVEVYKLGKRLFADGTTATGLDAVAPQRSSKRQTMPNKESVDEDDPALLVHRLEGSKGGCLWLRLQWTALGEQLERPTGGYFQRHDWLRAVKLIGRTGDQAMEDSRVAEIFLASDTLNPDDEIAIDDIGSDLGLLRRERLVENVIARWGHLVPNDRDKARAILDDLVESNIKRLDELLEEHAQKADATAEARFVRLNGDETPEGRSIRAYKKRCESAFLRGLEACKKYKGKHRSEGAGRTADGAEQWCDRDGRLRASGGGRDRAMRTGAVTATNGSAVMEEGAVDLSWAYETGWEAAPEPVPAAEALPTGEALGAALAEAVPAAGDHGTATCGQAGGGVGDPRRTEKDRIEADFVENEANFGESVIVSERLDCVDVVANSDALLGLDKGGNEANSEPMPVVVRGGEIGGYERGGGGDAGGTDTGGEVGGACRTEAEAPHPGPLPVGEGAGRIYSAGIRRCASPQPGPRTASGAAEEGASCYLERSDADSETRSRSEVLNSQSEIASRELVVCDRKSEIENPRLAKRVPAASAAAAVSKREKKRWRREMERRELDRRRAGEQKGDQKIEDVLGGLECLLPNVCKVLREELARAP